ncbi:MAG TPA: EamA family transporter [Rikenellaceae bacterium]|nr:EamA family transporter [Rikenellaceae bacterium]HBH21165.1 EamA family transporter [Rikenellaceae bacterium]HCZ23059.1 EamA family transporter [Rikenellaceae bacterium]
MNFGKIAKNKLLGNLACFIAYTIFGINIVTCKDLSNSHLLSPLALFCLRAFGAGILFWILSLCFPREKVAPKDLPKIFAASFVGFFLVQFSFLSAIPDVTPMTCSIISTLTPIYTMFIAALTIKEPITWKKAGGVLLSFCGIVIFIVNSNTGGSGAQSSNLKGILLMLVNGLSFAAYLAIFKPLISKYSVVSYMKWIFLFAFLMSAPFCGKELLTFDYGRLSGAMIVDLAVLIICATFVSYFLISFGQKFVRPTMVSLYSYMQPIIAILISIIAGMDSLTITKIVALAAVVGGVLLVSFSKSRPAS